MRYLKLYEDFKTEQSLIEPEIQINQEVSDITTDDVLKDEFFKDLEEDSEEVYKDEFGVYHIRNWTVY